MKKHAVVLGKVLGFLIVTLALGWLLNRGVGLIVRSELLVEGVFAAVAIATTWGATKLEGRSLASVGFEERAPARHFVIGVALGTLIVGGCTVVFSCFGWYQARYALGEPFVPWLLAAVVLTALVALFEETLFRGYALQTAARSLGSTGAVIVTGALFGALHLVNPTPGIPLWLKLVGCGCVAAYGMLNAVARFATSGLWLPMGIHFVWDLLEDFVFGFPASGNPGHHGLLHANVTGPVLLTGGGYGPEAGLIMLLLAGVAILLIVAPKRGAREAEAR